MKEIAILLNSGFGDLVLLTTLFESIKKAHKKNECRITAIGNVESANILFNNPYIDDFILSDRFEPKGIFDEVINTDMSNTIFPSAMYRSKYHYFDIAEQYFGYPLKKYKPYLYHTPEEVSFVKDFVKEKDKPVVVIHTTNVKKQPNGKALVQGFWNELIHDNHNLLFAQLGTKDKTLRGDADMNLTVQKNYLDCRGQFTIRQAALLVKNSLFHVTVDSVIQHLSYWAQKPGIVIFGSSSPAMQGHSHNTNIWDDRECSPCVDNIKNQNCCQIRGINHVTVPEINTIIRKKFFDGKQRKKVDSGWKIEE